MKMTNITYPKIMLTGRNGQVGWELRRTLAPLGEVIALDRQQLDLTNPDQIRERVRATKPDIIVNAAAYTAVDKAEEEPELTMTVNGTAPGILAEEAKRLGAALVHFSTDYVFDGTKTVPYTEDDQPNPINVYGKTKLAGERAIQAVGVPHLILRTSWVYGMRRQNFLLTILRLAKERDELNIVDDQTGAPTWSRMIAGATTRLLVRSERLGARDFTPRATHFTGLSGIYHLTASGSTSWYGFAGAILKQTTHQASRNLHLCPVPTTEYPTPAQRPKYSVLSNTKLKKIADIVLPNWEQTLKMAIGDY